MYLSRLFSRVAAVSAAIVVTSVGFAHAAIPGGANVRVTGDVTVPFTPNADGMFFIEASGTFFAQSLIEDPGALHEFALSTSLVAGGRSFFDEIAITGETSVNALLGGGDVFNDVAEFGGLIVGAVLQNPTVNVTINDDPIFNLFQGAELGLNIENAIGDPIANSIEGDYTASALLNGEQLGAVAAVLQAILVPQGGNSINFEPAFSFEFNAEIAPIPLPAALPLLLSSFVMLGFMGWRRKAAA